ncbi:ABC transporter substrate-binding protein [Williamsia phyllosphaerae]|uniref:Fe/B12 periplasmic-binding domain-containing protein n=1 Tax=Williamsia phyllosphaerae TaxID=885042 RepID=A0ABQ1U5A1_9NOCA|nr:ABC transporter substrate-binding protein [Williamsia phyllosphaerae]GGF09851.1 hypothetical protein GCM10007298_02250 [Williamsia phyllosphaerae]
MKAFQRTPRVIAAAVVALFVLGLAACSSPDEGDDASGSVAPVTVNTSAGSVTLDRVPERIAAIGDQWTDAVLSFGVTPAAYGTTTEQQIGRQSPWTEGKLGDAKKISLTGDRVSQIAAAKPDLILLPGFGVESAEIDKLKQIAPTIPSITGQQIDPWQDQVQLLGAVLREPDKATEIVNGVQSKIDKIKQDNPGLAGKTFAFAYMFSADQIQVLGDPKDGATSLFADLGLTVPQRLQDIAAQQKLPRFPISTENVPQLDSDLLVIAAGTPQLAAQLKTLPGYAQLTAVRANAVAQMDLTSITALNLPSPLSIPYVLDQLTPAVQAAGRS